MCICVILNVKIYMKGTPLYKINTSFFSTLGPLTGGVPMGFDR